MDTHQPSPERDLTGQRDVGAVIHAIRILQHLSAATAPLGVAAVARGTGISPSTCFNILRTLTRTRFVAFREQDKTYSLGLGVAELAAGFLGISHAELIRPELERLALNYDMLIVLWRVTEDGHIVLIDRAHSHTAVRVEMRLGLRLPMLVGAVGRCVAAALDLPQAELRRRFAALRWQSPPSFESYLADVEAARGSGWSLDNSQLYRGLITIAALITDQHGQPRFGLSGITIAGQRPPQIFEQLGRELREVAGFATRALFPRDASIQNIE
ncbi:IclR family transcriptional regulator [Roseomonas sp. KE0001]|uniref:IclR family transcriptional regulator n=1 Tax=Roseomonas sp. KE0001 TaxID=2479201 RepID=UPI0018E01571|nr:IclR family transcriptional regulator [Roseomonas sp. KE0001]MBI0435846.1 IclR family transcriptional regulator [Roseomonas sp. KE0001]